jgi:hypothetical protein
MSDLERPQSPQTVATPDVRLGRGMHLGMEAALVEERRFHPIGEFFGGVDQLLPVVISPVMYRATIVSFAR